MNEYIKRDEAIAALDEFRLNQTVSKYATVMQCRAARDAISRAAKALESLPAADVEPLKRGRWVHKILLGEQAWFCSECKTIGSPAWKRCPVCEAKMDEEVKHER